jgi:hypothetical protein
VLAAKATVRRNYRRGEPAATHGSITRNIAVVLLMEIVQLQTSLAACRAETHWPIAKPVRGNRSAVREAISPAVIEAGEA